VLGIEDVVIEKFFFDGEHDFQSQKYKGERDPKL